MYVDEDEQKTTSGYLIVKTRERMSRESLNRCKGQTPDRVAIIERYADLHRRYRGMARYPLQPWIETLRDSGVVEPTEQELDASVFMNDLQDAGKSLWDFVFSFNDVEQLMRKIVSPIEREVIWVRRMDTNDPPPPKTNVLGYEPSWFYAPYHSSGILDDYGDCLFFLKGYADTPEARTHSEKINEWLLFDTPGDAEECFKSLASAYERVYHWPLSLYIAEVRLVL